MALGQIQIFTLREAELFEFMIDRIPDDISQLVLCPMPGLLVDLKVAVGDEVSEGQSLCRLPDGSDTWDFSPTPTPGSSNN